MVNAFMMDEEPHADPGPEHIFWTATNATAPLSELMERVQRGYAAYFWEGAHPPTGLPFDRCSTDGRPISDLISIGGTGFGIMAILVLVHRQWVSRSNAYARILKIVATLEKIPRFRGAFPHFISANTLEVVPFVPHDDGGDLVETALLVQGLICAREFFDCPSDAEAGLRRRIDSLCVDIEWVSYVRPSARPSLYWHWSPKHGWALNTPITGWNEALSTYVLAAGSASHAIEPEIFHIGWTNEGRFRNGSNFYGTSLPAGSSFGGPLFLSQYSFCALDPRQMQDDQIDYWQQVVAHTKINFEHCRRNPNGHIGYGTYGWGLTASDGPSGYVVSCPVNDRGILAPMAALSSFPFLPKEAESALRAFLAYGNGRLWGRFGFADAFAPGQNWVSNCYLAINQGPVVAMIENFRSGLLWRLFMGAPEVKRGLSRLGIRYKVSPGDQGGSLHEEPA
ncbi:hypothetical protein SAMN02927900_06185 [Rhizobium mongolense subsp. loessense]|uniref:Glycoamylase-like domain-containing protein n=1 Tax=Rhizobium mongolense subsp. loessense TaxID=158890 RepID=A0A1G4U5T9_9HYPH|nr:glucoamylase family protein [Rhizobium mongolense]SCW88994.1 hypothetical protein SAMN02927900_06185 [Rhizobium mongolense subsp. loessense]